MNKLYSVGVNHSVVINKWIIRIMEKNKHNDKEHIRPSQKYRGMEINIADDSKADSPMVKKDVEKLNNNPRNSDM